MSHQGWIGVDLDGTLAKYDGYHGVDHIGDPVPAMRERVIRWLSAGIDVRIFSARVGPQKSKEDVELSREAIKRWCLKHLYQVLPVTATKDYSMRVLYDDRCVAVEPNTGRILGGDASYELTG